MGPTVCPMVWVVDPDPALTVGHLALVRLEDTPDKASVDHHHRTVEVPHHMLRWDLLTDLLAACSLEASTAVPRPLSLLQGDKTAWVDLPMVAAAMAVPAVGTIRPTTRSTSYLRA